MSSNTKSTVAGIVLIGLAVLFLSFISYLNWHNAIHHSVELKISGDPAIVKVTYDYSLPSPSQNQISMQTTELSVAVPWETKIDDVEGLEPTVKLHLVRPPGDNRPLSCAVKIGNENANLSMAPGQTEITCQVTIRKPEQIGPTSLPSGASG